MKGAPLTVAEARAILIADEALVLSYDARQASGQILGVDELNAWAALVESATARIARWERKPTPSEESDLYPGGNEPGFQTLFIEAVARSKKR